MYYSSVVLRLGRLCVIVLAGVFSVAAFHGRAAGEEDPEALIRLGNQLRKKGDNERAHGYFKRAYEIAHTGRTAAQVGLAELALARFLDAEIHLTEALSNSDAWVEQNRNLIVQAREKDREHLGKVEVHGAPARTTVEIDGRAATAVPVDGILWAGPGPTVLTFASSSGQQMTRKLQLAAGTTSSLDLGWSNAPPPVAAKDEPGPGRDATPSGRASATDASGPSSGETSTATARAEGSQADTAASSGHRNLRIAGIATAGAGVAAAVTGFLVYHAGNSKLDAIKSDAAAGRPYDDGNANYQTLQRTGVGLMIAGGAVVAGGVVLYLLNRDGDGEAKGATVSFDYLPGGGGIQIAGRLP